jgi:hypothetical protein
VDPRRRSDRARNDLDADPFMVLNSNWAELRAVAVREERNITALAAQVAPAPVSRVPLLGADIHDLDGVQTVADYLFGPSGTGHRSGHPVAMR